MKIMIECEAVDIEALGHAAADIVATSAQNGGAAAVVTAVKEATPMIMEFLQRRETAAAAERAKAREKFSAVPMPPNGSGPKAA